MPKLLICPPDTGNSRNLYLSKPSCGYISGLGVSLLSAHSGKMPQIPRHHTVLLLPCLKSKYRVESPPP